jgi:hypothetical protein
MFTPLCFDSLPIKNESIAFISGLLNWAKNLLTL